MRKFTLPAVLFLLCLLFLLPDQGRKLHANAEADTDELVDPPKIEDKLGAVPHGLSTDSDVAKRLIYSPKGLASPEQTATGKDFSNPFIVSGLLINQMVIKSTIVFELKLLASPEQTATGKDKSNPLIVADLLINQMVIRCTIVFELKHLATPVVMAIGKETSFPLVSMIHLSQELIRLEVMRIVCNDYELMVDWSFVVSKIWYISRWCYSWILDSWFFVAATNIVCNVYVLMVAWFYVDSKIWRLSRWCFSWNWDIWFFVAAGWKRDVFWSQISAWFYS